MRAQRSCFALALLFVASLARAQAPVREEQTIISILAFNGKAYSSTFSGRHSDTLCLVAGVDSFLTVRNCFVYFWPLTGEWKSDTSVLDVPFSGTLEVRQRGKREPRIIAPVRCTYYNTRGEYELNWKVATGDEADRVWTAYQGLVGAYYMNLEEYYRKQAAYESRLAELNQSIISQRNRGTDASETIRALQSLSAPREPEFPGEYVTPPRPVEEAFIVNLPAGEYSIRFVSPDGSVVEGTERRLISFRKARSNGVGLEVIPGDKWTRPVESATPHAVLYVDGTADLYVQPFLEDEYNDLYYEQMLRNDAKGNPDVMKWVQIQQVPSAQIEISLPGEGTRRILEKPFYVDQVEGASLGYRIVPFDPQGVHAGLEASLRAFHIPFAGGVTRMRLQVLDREGNALPGGDRQVRVVGPTPMRYVPLILAVLPLAGMAGMLIARSRRARVEDDRSDNRRYGGGLGGTG